jgi:uncharacterized protein YodC (DUF2158 family)
MSLQRSKAETEQFERLAVVAALSWLCDPLRTMENFTSGDLVQLKSGGPIMTAGQAGSDGRIMCAYFDGNALKHVTIPPEQLKKVEPPEPPTLKVF